MSAFICGPDHFKALAIFAATRKRSEWHVDPRYIDGMEKHAAERHKDAGLRGVQNFLPYELATLYADVLYQENIRSVRVRYPEDKWDDLAGPIIKPLRMLVTDSDFRDPALRLPLVAIFKLCDCLEYQSCETEDWPHTLAWRLLDQIRREAVRQLPGYDKAPWDYYAEEARAA